MIGYDKWGKPTAGFWIAVALLAVLVGFPLSLFPITWLETRNMMPDLANHATAAYCAPAYWLADHGPEWIGFALDSIQSSATPLD